MTGVHVKVAGKWQEIGVSGSPGISWAKVAGGTVTTVTNPDGSVDEVHTFTANGTLTVLEPGHARVLVCGAGGSNGVGAGNSAAGGGNAVEGIHPLSAGQIAVTVGTTAASNTDQGAATGGFSALGSIAWAGGGSGASAYGYPPFGTYSPWKAPGGLGGLRGNNEAGGGALGVQSGATPGPGLVSDISGASVEYGKGGFQATAPTLPGQGAKSGDNSVGMPGRVIVRVQKSAPTVSGVAATGGTVTTYTGDGTNGVLGQNYKVHTFTADGNFVVTQGGEIELFAISGGGAKDTGRSGSGGRVLRGLRHVGAGTVPVVVGAGAVFNGTAYGAPSSFGGESTGAAAGYSGAAQSTGAGSTIASPTAGLVSYINGSAVEYGKVGDTTPGSSPSADNSNGIAGVVIVRYKVA